MTWTTMTLAALRLSLQQSDHVSRVTAEVSQTQAEIQMLLHRDLPSMPLFP